ncbi:hypothetical protein EK904_001009 [Melospiza melodia maxima]|nr:hypothetical protein EK904_001009 [Melospiza melodia maxima]
MRKSLWRYYYYYILLETRYPQFLYRNFNAKIRWIRLLTVLSEAVAIAFPLSLVKMNSILFIQVAFRVPEREYSGQHVQVPHPNCAIDALPSLAFRDFPLLRICRAASSDRNPDTTDTFTPAFSKTSPSCSTQLMPPPPANARLQFLAVSSFLRGRIV